MTKEQKTIYTLCGVILGIIVGIGLICNTADAKMVKEYVGEVLCTTYHVSDNTPAGTRATSSGARATEYHTIAVDSRSPMFQQGTRLYVDGFGEGVVEDVGGFARYGVGLDLFTPEGDGYKKYCKVWVLRKETKAEKKARLEELEKRRERIRKERQRGEFNLVYDPSLLPWQIITDPDYIKGGTVRVGYTYLDVVGTEKDLGNTIKTGQIYAYFGMQATLDEVFENAVG